jgi:predicted ferric reductase
MFGIPVAPSTAGIRGRNEMLMTIFVILLVMWFLGMVTSYTLYGYIHILLIIAIAVLLIRVIQGRRPI